jgi:hypothetical protein
MANASLKIDEPSLVLIATAEVSPPGDWPAASQDQDERHACPHELSHGVVVVAGVGEVDVGVVSVGVVPVAGAPCGVVLVGAGAVVVGVASGVVVCDDDDGVVVAGAGVVPVEAGVVLVVAGVVLVVDVVVVVEVACERWTPGWSAGAGTLPVVCWNGAPPSWRRRAGGSAA